MRARFFLDSNIILYNFDPSSPQKQNIAQTLTAKALTGEGCISTQVVQECLYWLTMRAKRRMVEIDATSYLKMVLEPLTRPLPLLPLYRQALTLQARWQFAFYNALIVAAAMELGCSELYSEDFQHRQRVGDLTIINPFI